MRFIASTDAPLRQAYEQLVRDRYEAELGIEGASIRPSDPDRTVDVLALRGDSVVGGLRLVIGAPESGSRLPMESGDFRLTAHLEDLRLEQCAHGELCRAVVHKSVVGSRVLKRLLAGALVEAQARGLEIVLWLAATHQATYYTRLVEAHGVRVVTRPEIQVPYAIEYRGTPPRRVVHVGYLGEVGPIALPW